MSETTPSHKIGEHPDWEPPITSVGVIGWMRNNLFSSPSHVILTLVATYIIWLVVPPVFSWAIIDAQWTGTGGDDCKLSPHGACWAFVWARFGQFMYGFYPEVERWRVNLGYILLIALAIPLFLPAFKHKRGLGLFLLIVYPVIAFILFSGGLGLATVETPLWGGLFLTLVIGGVGIVTSLPIGVVLALGRQSDMPAIRALCIAFIELWRGVPLITVLFMASVMLPLFLPEGTHFDKLLRALIGVSMFSSAYMAEVIRGGLQAIPKGQYEAAEGMGLGYWRVMGLVILPQALKLVIPGIVNTFIGLFKDTTLVLIIGLFDLLGIVQTGLTDQKWFAENVPFTGYAFAAMTFWVFCFSMSRYSMYVERKLHTGHKRN